MYQSKKGLQWIDNCYQTISEILIADLWWQCSSERKKMKFKWWLPSIDWGTTNKSLICMSGDVHIGWSGWFKGLLDPLAAFLIDTWPSHTKARNIQLMYSHRPLDDFFIWILCLWKKVWLWCVGRHSDGHPTAASHNPPLIQHHPPS